MRTQTYRQRRSPARRRSRRREITLPASMMRISTVQRSAKARTAAGGSFPRPSSLGTTAYAENVRCIDGDLRPVCGARALATVPYRPVFTDERRGITYIFTQSDSGTLRQAVAVDSRGSVRHINRVVAELPQRVAEGVRTGDFTVLRMEDGTIGYMAFDDESALYSYLGAAPALPSFEIAEESQPPMEGVAAGVTFRETVEDMRSGVPEAIGSALTQSALEAWRDAVRMAERAGVWTSPCAVRVGMRLWDGRLVALSAPHIVGGGVIANLAPEVSFPLTLSEKGYTAARAGVASAGCYRLRVRVDAASDAEQGWRGIVRRIEVWVSDPYDAEAGTDVSVHFRQGTPGSASGSTIAVKLGVRDTTDMVDELIGCKMRLLHTVPYGSEADFLIERRADSTLLSPAQSASRLTPLRAGAIVSHDGFLHLGDLSMQLPLPAVPSAAAGARPFGGAGRVEVDVRTRRGIVTVGREAVIASLDVGPLLWYGDSRAERMRVYYRDASGLGYVSEFPLTPVSGEDAAYYSNPHGAAMSLDSVAKPCTLPSDAGERPWERYPEGVATCHRGNPLAVCSQISSAGATVTALAAQQTGGGAFTRQFVYVFTDNGISGLNHDMDGRYTNMRSLSRARVDSRERIVATSDGIYVLCDGELLLLRDSHEEHLLRGLTEYTRLMHDRRHDELWLCPDADAEGGKSLALSCRGRDGVAIDGSVRTLNPRYILRSGGSPLTAAELGNLWNVYMPEWEEAPELKMVWESQRLHLGVRGVGVLRVAMGGYPDGTAEVTLSACGSHGEGEDGATLLRAEVSHPLHCVAELPFVAPRGGLMPADAATFRVGLAGEVRYLREIILFETIPPSERL